MRRQPVVIMHPHQPKNPCESCTRVDTTEKNRARIEGGGGQVPAIARDWPRFVVYLVASDGGHPANLVTLGNLSPSISTSDSRFTKPN
jgi:hypothetical protein